MLSMEVVVGTYEEVLIGLRLNKVGDAYTLTESFTDKSNIGSIRCVAISQQGILASGGTDEIVHIFNLKTHRLVGTLTHHSGTITTLQFFKKSFLFSTSEDGTFCAWRMGTWEPRTFKGHKGPVNCAAVHPSGKLALTVSQDKSLRTWNLVDGRPAFVSNIKETASHVLWSPDEKHYLVAVGKKIDVYSVEDGKVHRTIVAEQKMNSIFFATDSIIVYGGEGNIQKNAEREKAVLFFVDIIEGKVLHEIETESSRIRDLAVCPSHENPDSGEKWLTSVASDGTINIYRINLSGESVESSLIVSRNFTLRLTCVAVSSPTSQDTKSKKRKMEEVKVEVERVSDSDHEVEESALVIKTESSDSDVSGEAKESDADEESDEPKAKKMKKTPTTNGKNAPAIREKTKQKKKKLKNMKSSNPSIKQAAVGVGKQKGKKGNKTVSKTSPDLRTAKPHKKVKKAEPAAFGHLKQKTKKGKQKIKKHF